MTFSTVGTPRVEREDQSVNYIEIADAGGTAFESGHVLHRLRITIHSNAYTNQSWAKVERWDGTQWHEVVAMSGASLIVGCHQKLYLLRTADLRTSLFAADRERLLVLAGDVLGR